MLQNRHYKAFPRRIWRTHRCAAQAAGKCSKLWFWQIQKWIHRLALFAHFKMQHDAIGITIAHFRNFLALRNGLVFSCKQLAVMRVCSYKSGIVLPDDEMTVATQSVACIDHPTGPGRLDGPARLAAIVAPLVY